MKNNESIRIAVAETSVIIRSGLTLALKQMCIRDRRNWETSD